MAERENIGRAPAWARVGRRVADALADVPDVRDQIFQPPLKPLPPRLRPFDDKPGWWRPNRIRDQGAERSCVGHALAAVIDHMRAAALVAASTRSNDLKSEIEKTLNGPFVSAEMLYQMAQFHDEWSGEDYSGSSIRGGLKGFFYNGVCSQAELEQRQQAPLGASTRLEPRTWFMTKKLAENARTIQLGAYYRIRPRLPDMHAAINDANAIVASATIHDGWERLTADGTIPFSDRQPATHRRAHAMHAFAIIGYDDEGFWVQNSWGTSWGLHGLARWCYEDWAANVVDAWTLCLAVLPPAHQTSTRRRSRLTAYGKKIDRAETHFLGHEPVDASGPSRLDVLGHLVPFRDGRLDRRGPYNVNPETLNETLKLIRSAHAAGKPPAGSVSFAGPRAATEVSARKYRHILIYFLGGWTDENRLAATVADVIPTFTELGIYPFFVSLDTPIFLELNLAVRRAIAEVAEMTRATPATRRLVRDRLIEGRIALPGNRLLRELRLSARRVFRRDQPDPDYAPKPRTCGEGARCLARLFEELAPFYRDGSIDFHVVAHGFGGQVLIECLAQQRLVHTHASFTTCTLISPLLASHRIGHPAGSQANGLYDSLVARGERVRRRSVDGIAIEHLRLITLSERAMKIDRFSDGYGQAWPLMWSYVMGLDPTAIETGRSVQVAAAVDGARQRFRHVPLLGLPTEAEDFARTARAYGLNVSTSEVVPDEEEVDSSLHHELGFHPEVLDRVAGDILGNYAPGTFRSASRKIELRETVR